MTGRGGEMLLRGGGGVGLELGYQGHLSCFWHVEWVSNHVGRLRGWRSPLKADGRRGQCGVMAVIFAPHVRDILTVNTNL